jgi:sugar lactone lactonase YvrE
MKKYSTLFLAGALFVTACSKKTETTSPSIVIQNTPDVITLAGSGTQGFADGTKALATFNYPAGITINSDGFLFIADKLNNIIRIISPQGVVNRIAGTGASGLSNAKDSVAFNFPSSVAVDAAGNVYVADQGNSVIREINIQGVVTTLAGKGSAIPANFNGPSGVAADAGGNVYVADNGNNMIRKISSKGVLTTFAGSGVRGASNGTGTAATFNQPQSLAVDSDGNVYVADAGNNLIRKISAGGVVTTLAGSGNAGAANGVGTAASFNRPAGIAVDASGNVYVGDSNNNMIRKISPDGTVITLAGTGAAGASNGLLAAATFNGPQGVAVDQYKRVFVVDTGNGLIRIIRQ